MRDGSQLTSRVPGTHFLSIKLGLLLLLVCFVITTNGQQQSRDSLKNHQLSMEIYGFILGQAIYDFKQMDPKWFDVPRPTKLPAYKDQFAPDGQMLFSMRQTRFGIRGYTPTPIGELHTWFEFDLFGSGADAGQTTFHLRHAYGEIGKFGVGQTWSPFVDADLFPNDLEYWGPNGMANIRNIQIRYMPIQGKSKLTIALEKPGGTADDGIYSGRIELKSVKPHFDLPDLSAEYRHAMAWGYVELAGIVRQLKWKDLDTVGKNLSGHAIGWGLNLSSGIKVFTHDMIHLQVLYGEGIENYIRDAPADVAIQNDAVNSPKGVALPVLGLVAFYDRNWNDRFSSTFGYSQVKITNTNAQLANAFKLGEYALADIIYKPAKDVFMEIEFQYLQRKNYSDGWTVNDPRIEFAFRYNFSKKFYHEANTTP